MRSVRRSCWISPAGGGRRIGGTGSRRAKGLGRGPGPGPRRRGPMHRHETHHAGLIATLQVLEEYLRPPR